jgi:hypothetical protein
VTATKRRLQAVTWNRNANDLFACKWLRAPDLNQRPTPPTGISRGLTCGSLLQRSGSQRVRVLFGGKTEWLRHFVESSTTAGGLIPRVMPSDVVKAAGRLLADMV